MKIYIKKGTTNYKEKRLVNAIEKALTEKSESDPSFANGFKPATTFDELKEMHSKYCITDVEFTETKADAKPEEEFKTSDEKSNFDGQTKSTVEQADYSDFIDPFNREEPIVRGYVMDSGFKEDDGKPQAEEKTSFDEPKNHSESFQMPSEEDEKGNNDSGNTKNTTSDKKDKKDKPLKQESVNPSFDDMGAGRKKRSTKKLATMIVGAVCILAEKGCIWWTTKDITEDKLIQYELENTIDMQILLTLPNGQQQIVKNWFLQKLVDSKDLFKVGEQDRLDLIDNLVEVMLEKGIALTPTQELMANVGKTFLLDMGLKAYAFGAEISNVLSQLKQMTVAGVSGGTNESDYIPDAPDTFTENPAMETPQTEQASETGLAKIED